MKARYWVLIALAACLWIGIWWDNGLQGWMAIKTGSRCGSTGVPYCYWSGFGSVWPWSLLSLGGIASAVLLLWRTHTCNRHWWCWRKPDHPLEGNEHIRMCRVHHPDRHMSMREAIEHHIHLRRKREARDGSVPVAGEQAVP